MEAGIRKTYKKDELICSQGDEDFDLYWVEQGELLVFVTEGTKVHPVAIIPSGQFLGELSYFDHQKRSAYVMAKTDCTLIQLPLEESQKVFPNWLYRMGQDLTKRLRQADELVRKNGLKKKKVHEIEALSIEEQRHILSITKGDK
ncbi:cyclic nucleotide-binding domain-containing protein [Halobacteriovorax sp. GB3]|uniref:Crp/Fnr family transcriptional regulator n=1 Tax=Halobacteriovorax sp. GB3 TaxID=2719615 RepID=UPI0023624DC7|nr:cyclic nucleotide-binding domain-containing protein [Halobacteriovorax sp. GB3]MDD0853163.1 cyclic nucleotide-binding domain-containing protein [Halobacteriovorax sp. GB3]